ncbi:MAG TPA: hypothetical protein VN890_06770 [Methylocella sp.]|nr:hypothetical protein [Methylocella sp.]
MEATKLRNGLGQVFNPAARANRRVRLRADGVSKTLPCRASNTLACRFARPEFSGPVKENLPD